MSTKRMFLQLVYLSLAVSLVAAGCAKQGSAPDSKAPQKPGSGPGSGGNGSAPEKPETPEQAIEKALLRSNYSVGQITKLCEEAILNVDKNLNVIAALPASARTFDNTMLALETALADFSDEASRLTFMAYVSTNAEISNEASDCEKKISAHGVTIGTRRDLYEAIKGQSPRNEDEARLLSESIRNYEDTGLKLEDSELLRLKQLMSQLSEKEAEFSNNLNTENLSLQFSAAELTGVSKDVLGRLTKTADGSKYIVTAQGSDFSAVMDDAKKPETRKRMLSLYLSQGGEKNTKLLQEALALRARIAETLGYKSWADYKISSRMAKSSDEVLKFLNSLKAKLAERNKSDFAQLLKFKKEIEPSAKVVNHWDISYLRNQLQKRDFKLDAEKVREYFPIDTVIEGMFSVYSRILGVSFAEIKGKKLWADTVRFYEVRDLSNGAIIGFFYTDFFPRANKYGHAAAFPLVSGRRLTNGTYSKPVSAIVANLTPATADKPSLLSHEDVLTIFHEFGHIMHQTLTRAPYASLSGSSVSTDFVEAPSQMLENWVWSPTVLAMISGHYLDKSRKLPPETLEKLIAARGFMQGMDYTKQLLYALYDMSIHAGKGSIDVHKGFDDLYTEIVGQKPIQGGKFAAGFGHLMGGYDAGYYGYLWSEVYAQDMFSRFAADGLLDPGVGSKYRSVILERGDMKDADVLLKEFLGRDPSPEAFFKKLGVPQSLVTAGKK